MRERSLVAFTILGQTAAGMSWAVAGAGWMERGAVDSGSAALHPMFPPLLAIGPLLAIAALASLLHLGSPRNAWRALANLRSSWLSREILGLLLFGTGWVVLVGLVSTREPPSAVVWATAGVVAALGAGLVYGMSQVYRLRTVPAWDTALTPAAFFLTAASLGGLATAFAACLAGGASAVPRALVVTTALCLLAEGALEPAWRALRRVAEGRVDTGLHPRSPARGFVLLRRPLLLAAAVVLSFGWAAGLLDGAAPLGVTLAAAALSALFGRSDFYRSHARFGL